MRTFSVFRSTHQYFRTHSTFGSTREAPAEQVRFAEDFATTKYPAKRGREVSLHARFRNDVPSYMQRFALPTLRYRINARGLKLFSTKIQGQISIVVIADNAYNITCALCPVQSKIIHCNIAFAIVRMPITPACCHSDKC